MRAKALQTDRLICIDPGCMIVVTNEIESTLQEPRVVATDLIRIHVRSPTAAVCRGTIAALIRLVE
jgi:hypothetical protein